MKKLTLGLSLALLSTLAMAENTVTNNKNSSVKTEANVFNQEQYEKDLNNPELFKSHQIQITKEEKHHFLFFPYTKEVPVSNIQLTGVETTFSAGKEITYISSATKEENKDVVYKNSVLTSGISVKINKATNNTQTLSFSTTDLLNIKNYTSDDGITIQLPSTESQSFSFPISSDNFETKWKSQDGIVYHLRYNGQKTLVKS